MTSTDPEPPVAQELLQRWKAMSSDQRAEYKGNLIAYVDTMFHQSEILAAQAIAKARKR